MSFFLGICLFGLLILSDRLVAREHRPHRLSRRAGREWRAFLAARRREEIRQGLSVEEAARQRAKLWMATGGN
jgi:hypothetical protein